jgi:uncharacterized membrane protein HdeD (DUF308 family)
MRILVVDVDTLARNWWAALLRGLAAILFGVLTFLSPAISLAALVLVFGVYAIADGVLAVVTALRRRGGSERWGMLLLEGVVGVLAGVVALIMPGITALALLYVIAAWAVVTGALEIAAAIQLRKAISGEWLLALSGVLSVGFCLLLVAFPGAGALTVVLWIGAYALVFGALLIALAFRLRALRGDPTPRAAHGVA